MKNALLLLLFAVSLSVQAQNKFNPALKQQLDSIGKADQKYRKMAGNLNDHLFADSLARMYAVKPEALMVTLMKFQDKIDSVDHILVKNIIDRYGYPGVSLVGKGTNEVAWFVMQHSSNVAQYLPLVKAAADKNELPFTRYAMMVDRDLTFHNKEQIYGSQGCFLPLKSGAAGGYIYPIQDPEHVNERRKQAGFTTTVEQNALSMGMVYRVVKMDEIAGKYFVPVNDGRK